VHRRGLLRFRILGPLEVRDEHETLRLGSAKQRALLGVLLLHVNETVSTAHLADELWGDHPPATAEKLVQGYVHALRRQLGQDVIETRPPGYRIRAERDDLDLLEFEALVEEARDADAPQALELRRRALALWRGAALADVELEGPDRHVLARLGERRLTTQIELVEAGLELGRHAQLVGELEKLAAEHAYQERIAVLLMLALYRSGRQADALEAYRAIRRRLDDDLGLEPGQELRDLEAAILRQDPSLSPKLPPEEPAAAPPEEPSLPSAPRHRRLVAAALALLAALAAAVLLAVVLGRDAEAVQVPANSVALVDPDDNRVIDVVQGLIRPGPIAAGADAVWVGNLDDRALVRIDPQTRRIVKTIPLSATPDGLAVDESAVWVAHGRLGRLTRVDPRFDSIVETIPVAERAISFTDGSVAVRAGAVWAALGDSTLARIDARSNRTTGSTPAGLGPAAVVTGYGSVWVSLSGESLVRRYSAVTFEEGALVERSVGRSPTAMAAGEGAVWVACTDDDFVTRIDPGLGGSSSLPIGVGDAPSAVAVGVGAVWVANTGDGTLARIDPEKNEVVEKVDIGNAPAGIAVAGGLVWVTVQAP
jgi:DNA-binding SARP family transcriptional activator/streptogramin lyase